MRKIVIINHYGNTPDEPGATRHYELASYFAENTDKLIELWVCGYNHYSGKTHKTLDRFKLFSRENIKRFNLLRFRSIRYRKSNLLRQLNITVFDILTAFKIIFSRNIEAVILSVPPITVFNVMAIKLKRIKLIVDIEDLWPLFLKDMGLNNKFAIKYMEIASRYTYNSADAIEAVSSGMLEFAKNEIKNKNKLMWLSPLGINTEVYFNTELDNSIIENKSWKNDFIIMYIGAHNPANDLYSVLDTIELINKNNVDKDISFVFFGDGNELESLKRYKSNLSLNNVYFEGSIPSSQVNKYLMHADICLTNLQKIESFKLVRPNKLFQYMGLSKPIICGIWGEAKNIIENANSGIYVDFTIPEDASAKIIELLSNETQLREMRKNGKDYIVKHGSRYKIYEEFVTNIQKL